MANRFNQYYKTDYVNLPVEAYQIALSAKEAERQAELNAAKKQFDAMQAVEAIANPDIELKKHLLDNLNTGIEAIAKKDIKAPDALMELHKLVNDRSLVDQLASIYGNTVNIRAKQEADKKFMEEYGTNINTLRSSDELEAYNRLGREGFKAGLFSNYTPGKFVDVPGEMRTALKDMEASGWKRDTVKGGWIHRETMEHRTTEDLLRSAGVMIDDPKFKTQLQHLAYNELRPYGGNIDPKAAITNYNNQAIANSDAQLIEATSYLSKLQKAQAANKKNPQKYNKAIEDTKAEIENLKARRNSYATDADGRLFNEDMMEGIAGIAATGLNYQKTESLLRENKYGLLDAEWALRWNYHKNKTKLAEDALKEDYINSIQPTIVSKDIPRGNGVNEQVPVFAIEGLGGFAPEQMATLVANIANGIPNLPNDIGSAISVGGSVSTWGEGKDKGGYLAKGIREGRFQLNYSPRTNEIMVTGEGVQVRLPAPMNISERLKPISRLFNPQPDSYGISETHGVSLDGRTTSTIYSKVVDKEVPGTDGSKVVQHLQYNFTPAQIVQKGPNGVPYMETVAPFEINDKTDNVFKQYQVQNKTDATTTNVNNAMSLRALQSKNDGIYVMVKGRTRTGGGFKSNVYEYGPTTLILTPEDYNKQKADGSLELTGTEPFYVRKQSNTVQMLNPLEAQNGMTNILQSHMKYEANAGGSWGGARSKAALAILKHKTDIGGPSKRPYDNTVEDNSDQDNEDE